jgi:hypothetical protein
MMYLCATRFDIDDEQRQFLQSTFSRDEIEAAAEDQEDSPDQLDVDPISDNEEEALDDLENEAEREDEDAPEDTNQSLPLPEEANTQIRASVRPRKRQRRDDDQYSYY